MANTINWFEIPAADFDRAKTFYSSLFAVDDLQVMDMDGIRMGMLPMEEGSVSGAICTGEWYKPTADGSILYLNGGDDLSAMLGRAEAAGGHVILPKTSIGEHGYMALFIDSEGNRMGLHSQN